MNGNITRHLTDEVADFIAQAETHVLLAAMVVATEELLTRYTATSTAAADTPEGEAAPIFTATGGPAPADPLVIVKADEKFVASVTEAARTWVADQSGETLDGPDADLHLGWHLSDTVGQWLTEGRYPDGVEVSDITADAVHEYAIQGADPRDIGREVRPLLTQEN